MSTSPSDALLTFPAGFLWGAATSSHQVEGGNERNDWWLWEQHPGAIVDGSRSGDASGWWAGRAEEDLRLAASLGHNAHRLSLEWSRLEPEPGRFDDAAFERYRAILGTLRELGMTPSVTLYHFTLPQWAALRGGWEWEGIVAAFERYVGEAVRRLGDLVPWWATINEPMILMYMSYAGTRWPPGRGNIVAGMRAASTMLHAHHAAYLAAKRADPDARVGIVLNMPAIDPARRHPLDRAVSAMGDWTMNGALLASLARGRVAPPLGAGQRLAAGPNAADWYGLNYYGRTLLRFDIRAPGQLFSRSVEEGVRSADQSWGEIYPEGMVRALRQLARFGKPLFVTENGIFDPDDSRRPDYLVSHLRALHGAIAEGLDVRGYFHWSLVDNFEWAEGWTTPFGLIALDRATQARTPRPSAYLYERIIRANGVERERQGGRRKDEG